jgi:large conductance mechanosensitive channel
MKKPQMKGFVEFIREQGVVGLAIGFILGGAVSKLVASLVEDIIQPVIGLALGSNEGLLQLSAGPVMYGEFLAALIDFTVIAAVVYFGFKSLKLEKLDKKKS